MNQRSHSLTLQVFIRVLGAEQRLARTARVQPAVITNELMAAATSISSIRITTITTSILWLPSRALHTSLPFSSSLSHYIYNTDRPNPGTTHSSHNTCSLPRHQLQAWHRSVSINSPRNWEHKLQQAMMLQFQVSSCSSCTCIELWIVNPASYLLNSYSRNRNITLGQDDYCKIELTILS